MGDEMAVEVRLMKVVQMVEVLQTAVVLVLEGEGMESRQKSSEMSRMSRRSLHCHKISTNVAITESEAS